MGMFENSAGTIVCRVVAGTAGANLTWVVLSESMKAIAAGVLIAALRARKNPGTVLPQRFVKSLQQGGSGEGLIQHRLAMQSVAVLRNEFARVARHIDDLDGWLELE